MGERLNHLRDYQGNNGEDNCVGYNEQIVAKIMFKATIGPSLEGKMINTK